MDKRLYVASRASVPERSAMWRNLRTAGWPIISTWIDEAGEGETECNRELWARIHAEISVAHAVVLYAEPGDFPLKGALVEVGIAIGMNKPVMVCLPGVDIHPHTCRPVGSWMRHPFVERDDVIERAMERALRTTHPTKAAAASSSEIPNNSPAETKEPT